MHVTCPNCRARYAVDPTAIGPAGRTVQCSRCGHRWRERSASGAPAIPPPRPRAIPDLAIRPAAAATAAPAEDGDGRGRHGRWFAAAILLIVVASGVFFAFRSDLGNVLPAAWQPYLPFGTARGG